MASNEDPSAQAALAEFAALRSETLQAFSMQWNVVALQLTATAALFSFSLTNSSRTGFLLIVPIVSFVLSGRYLRSEDVINTIGTYIRNELSQPAGGLMWEQWYRGRDRTILNRVLRWIAHGPLVFSGISVIALVWVTPYILHVSKISTFDRSILWVVWALGCILTVIPVFLLFDRDYLK